MSDLYVSWPDYHQNIETLAIKIYQSGWNFNQIVCLAKGGLRVGDIICRLFRQPLAILSASSYGGSENRIRGEIAFSEHLSMINKKLNNRVLLVDDLVDSGASLQAATHWLKNYYNYEIEEIRTAVIWYKDCSVIKPDYYVEYLPDNPWIHQPFEIYEQITPAELATRYSRLTVRESEIIEEKQKRKTMTEQTKNHQVRRGRVFPEIQWSSEKKAKWKAENERIYQRCKVIFENVQPKLLKTHYNWFIAIEPNSGDYFIDRDEEVATQMLRQKYPNGVPVLFKINMTGACGTI